MNALAPGAWRANRKRRTIRNTPSWIAPDRALRTSLNQRVEATIGPPTPPVDFSSQRAPVGIDHPLTCLELEEMFETGRRLGLRMLNPFWDVDVVGMLHRTPPWLLGRGGRARSLVRDTVSRRFPGLRVEHQRTIAVTSFRQSLLEAQIPAIWRSTSRVQALALLGIVDARMADHMAETSITRRDHDGLHRTWDLLNLDAWVESRS
jgi:hypothetical protein